MMMQAASDIIFARRRGMVMRWGAAVCAGALALSARAESPADQLVMRVSAEVLTHPAPAGQAGAAAGGAAKLQPAERVVPGDVLIYTVEVRNAGKYAVESAIVVQAIPNHTMYLADSAVGPGVDVDYSIDGGRSFDKPENLHSHVPAEYTHIRWRLHNRLKPNSVAYVRFRAQVK